MKLADSILDETSPIPSGYTMTIFFFFLTLISAGGFDFTGSFAKIVYQCFSYALCVYWWGGLKVISKHLFLVTFMCILTVLKYLKYFVLRIFYLLFFVHIEL